MATGLGGEIAWYCPSLDDAGNGTTTLTDLSGNGKTGTLTNMDAATDWVADTSSGGIRSIDFDGTDDFIATTLDLGITGTLSISAWFKNRATNTGMHIAQGNNTNSSLTLQAALDGTLYFWPSFVNNRATCNWSSFGANWNHFVVLYDGSGANNAARVKIYINAIPQVLTFAGTIPATTSASANLLQIGSGPIGSPWSNGNFDDVRFWNRTLNLVEIAQLQTQRAFQPQSGGSAGFTGVRGTSRTLGT